MTSNQLAVVLVIELGLGVLIASVHDNLALTVTIAASMVALAVWTYIRSERHDA